MKKLLAITVAAAVMAMAGSAIAADSNTLTVSAGVTGTCKFSTGTSTLNFGWLDPSVASDVNGSGTTQFWCTKGVTTDAITANTGLNPAGSVRQMKHATATDLIPYSLSLTPAGSNAGPASPRTLTFNGTVLGSDYTSKTAGAYSDTVVLNITP